MWEKVEERKKRGLRGGGGVGGGGRGGGVCVVSCATNFYQRCVHSPYSFCSFIPEKLDEEELPELVVVCAKPVLLVTTGMQESTDEPATTSSPTPHFSCMFQGMPDSSLPQLVPLSAPLGAGVLQLHLRRSVAWASACSSSVHSWSRDILRLVSSPLVS